MRTASQDTAQFDREQWVDAWRVQNPGKKPIRLDASVPGQPMHGMPLAAMQAAVAQLGCKGTFPGVAQAGGTVELRKAAAQEKAARGVTLLPEELFAFPGSACALAAVLGLAQPGAHVLVPEPALPFYQTAARLAGHIAVPLEVGPESGFQPLPENIFTADFIVLASPSPVTGLALGEELLARWIRYAEQTGALLVVDTTYAMDGPECTRDEIFHSTGARTCAVELRDLSASEGFCAAPCTFVYAARELAPGGISLHSLLAARAACSGGVAHPVSWAAAALLAHPPQMPAMGGWRENAALLTAALGELGASFYGGQSAPFFWVRCPAGYENASEAFFAALLSEAGVVCIPGTVFGKSGEGWFRLSALCDKAAAEIALKRIRQQFRFP